MQILDRILKASEALGLQGISAHLFVCIQVLFLARLESSRLKWDLPGGVVQKTGWVGAVDTLTNEDIKLTAWIDFGDMSKPRPSLDLYEKDDNGISRDTGLRGRRRRRGLPREASRHLRKSAAQRSLDRRKVQQDL